jgi:hypothetical protein
MTVIIFNHGISLKSDYQIRINSRQNSTGFVQYKKKSDPGQYSHPK